MQNETTLPVFVFPTQLTFCTKDSSTHRRSIAIYNPYDFAVSYRVLCTSPANYAVTEPEGVLKPRCCVDVSIRRLNFPQQSSASSSPVLSAAGQRTDVRRVDKFRIYAKRRDKPEITGFRDVIAEIADRSRRETDGESTSSEFRGWPKTEFPQSSVVQYPLPSARAGGGSRPGWLLMIVAGICVACLGAPYPGEKHSSVPLPDWFSLTAPQKLVAAYVLGLVTAAFLQQT